jgi:hypothetical protein
MFPSKDGKGVEELANNNPQALLKKLHANHGTDHSRSGTGVGPVPEGIKIVDTPETRDAGYPVKDD